MNAPANLGDTRPQYGAIETRETDDGWFEAEVRLSRHHPAQMGTARTLEGALEMLERRMNIWRTQ